jgi:hypothetical protein
LFHRSSRLSCYRIYHVSVTCEEPDRAPRDQSLNLDLRLVLALSAWIPCLIIPPAAMFSGSEDLRVGGNQGSIDQTQCGTARRRTHSCCRTATTTVRSAVLPSLAFPLNECSDRGFSSMQPDVKAQVHRQELWA